MKVLILFIGLLFLFSCNSVPQNDFSTNENWDSTGVPLVMDELKDSILPAENTENQLRKNLINLLKNPIDLAAYKREYGPSNSGGYTNSALFDMPNQDGFFYRYMLFYKLKQVLKNHPSEDELFNKFSLIVYKFGDEVGNFGDENEVLMGIECGIDNETLGDLNVYGMTDDSLVEKFGKPQIRSVDNSLYFFENKVFSIHFTPDNAGVLKVDWFKYARLNPSIDLAAEIPDYLLNY